MMASFKTVTCLSILYSLSQSSKFSTGVTNIIQYNPTGEQQITSVNIIIDNVTDQVEIHLTKEGDIPGNIDNWTGFGFDATGMIEGTYGIILDYDGSTKQVTEYALGRLGKAGSPQSTQSITVISDIKSDTTREVIVTRPRIGVFTFPLFPNELNTNNQYTMNMISAGGMDPTYSTSRHQSEADDRATATVTFEHLPETPVPTTSPTNNPSTLPTTTPTSFPTEIPTGSPTKEPTELPTNKPTISPNLNPTTSPIDTIDPTQGPTNNPTTTEPTNNPTTTEPTKNPTELPTAEPTDMSTQPTVSPVIDPTNKPSMAPVEVTSTTDEPAMEPTEKPTMTPNIDPTMKPTMKPTESTYFSTGIVSLISEDKYSASMQISIDIITDEVEMYLKVINNDKPLVWTGFGFNTLEMDSDIYSMILDYESDTNEPIVAERNLGFYSAGDGYMTSEITVLSDMIENNYTQREVYVTRPRIGTFTFPLFPDELDEYGEYDMDMMSAVGVSNDIGTSGGHVETGAKTLTFSAILKPETTETYEANATIIICSDETPCEDDVNCSDYDPYGNGCKFICDECNDINLHCSGTANDDEDDDDDDDDNILCEVTCGTEGCINTNVFGGYNDELIINCNGEESCKLASFHGFHTNSLQINCLNGNGSCEDINIYCPPHNDDGTKECLLSNNKMNNDEHRFLDFYCMNGFDDIDLMDYSAILIEDINGTNTNLMHCGTGYEYSCELDDSLTCECDPDKASSSDGGEDIGLSDGEIAGIVIGCVVGLCLIIGVILYFTVYRKSQNNKQQDPYVPVSSNANNPQHIITDTDDVGEQDSISI